MVFIMPEYLVNTLRIVDFRRSLQWLRWDFRDTGVVKGRDTSLEAYKMDGFAKYISMLRFCLVFSNAFDMMTDTLSRLRTPFSQTYFLKPWHPFTQSAHDWKMLFKTTSEIP